MKKMTRRMEFTAKARKAIHNRDRETCVFCTAGYGMPMDLTYCQTGLQIMHIVPRSQLGMGVEENGALGCIWHHNMLDNGNLGRRKEMLGLLEQKMRSEYPGWSRERVTYRKGRELPAEESEKNEQRGSRNTNTAVGFERIEGIRGNIPI